jgi:hypothetical protein
VVDEEGAAVGAQAAAGELARAEHGAGEVVDLAGTGDAADELLAAAVLLHPDVAGVGDDDRVVRRVGSSAAVDS